MVDLVDMFEETVGDPHNPEEGGRDPLDIAAAVGLAETFLDNNNQDFENMESLFDDDNETHEKAERISLKEKINKQNMPAFEQMVMKRCGIL